MHLFSLIRLLPKIRICYTLFFCFRHFPFKQACRIPILFYRRARIDMDKEAKIVLGPEFTGRIRIGNYQLSFAHGKEYTVITNRGTLFFYGGAVLIQAGNVWYVQGEVHLGRDIWFGVDTQLSCYKRIEVKSTNRIAHQCQVRDCNFHYLRDRNTGNINPLASPIKIGTCCWVGNRTTIMPGTILPDYTIVGSNSLLNKDYSKILSPYSLLAGMPAKFVRDGIERVSFVDLQLEARLKAREFRSVEEFENEG